MRTSGNQLLDARGVSLSKQKPSPSWPIGMNAGGHVDKAARPCAARGGCQCGVVGRIGRVLREGVQDVGEHQFLVLLLVMQADLDESRTTLRSVGRRHVSISRSTAASTWAR